MGLPMARRLLQAGYRLSIYTRTPGKAESLVRDGARLATTAGQACVGATAVIAMTADDTTSQSAWLGPDGILAANLAPRSFAIECSTLSHEWAKKLAVEAGNRGLRYIDAPVTGVPEDAARGTLTLLVGAHSEDLDAARPLLSSFSDRVIRFGAPGAGTAYKLIVNLMGAVQIASAAEGLAIAERVGLDLKAVVDALATSQAASPQVVRNTRRMAGDDHHRNVVFTPQLRLKDVEYALRLARTVRIGSPFGLVARDELRQLCELSPGPVNESRILEVARLQKPRDNE